MVTLRAGEGTCAREAATKRLTQCLHSSAIPAASTAAVDKAGIFVFLQITERQGTAISSRARLFSQGAHLYLSFLGYIWDKLSVLSCLPPSLEVAVEYHSSTSNMQPGPSAL